MRRLSRYTARAGAIDGLKDLNSENGLFSTGATTTWSSYYDRKWFTSNGLNAFSENPRCPPHKPEQLDSSPRLHQQ